MEKQHTKRLGKICKILGEILLYFFLAVCLFSLLLSILAKKDADGAVTLFGYQMRTIRSESMAACPETDVSKYDIGSLPLKTMILIETVPTDPAEADAWYKEINRGDVLTFRYVYTKQETITHRVKDCTPLSGGGYTIRLVGDNKTENTELSEQVIWNTSDPTATNYVIGKVVASNYPLGLLVTAMREPVGIVCIIIIPAFIIMIFEIMRLYSLLTEKKRNAAKEESVAKEAELAELRARLAALEAKAGEPVATNDSITDISAPPEIPDEEKKGE